MFHRNTVGVILLVLILFGSGALAGVRLTQGQEADDTESSTAALGTGFTYQGQLSSAEAPVNTTCDFTFALYDAPIDGDQIGGPETETGVSVEDGRFTVILNDSQQFGPTAFNGDARWLDITVQCSGDGSATPLGRQPLTATPYATFATYALHTAGSPYENVIVVAKSGGDFGHIGDALQSISDASDSNRYLIWVAPGLYEEQVIMKPYVDIQGAGEELVLIRWGADAADTNDFHLYTTVRGASDSKLSQLTVENNGDFGASNHASTAGVYALDSDQFRMSHVTVNSVDARFWNKAIVLEDSNAELEHVTASGTGGYYAHGIYLIDDSSLILTDSDVSATGASNDNLGFMSDLGHSRIFNSRIHGDDRSVSEPSNDGLLQIANSQLSGEIGSYNFICVHSYDANYDELPKHCSPGP
jgi:hypothetical protein